MPLTRYQTRNEYSLADPELYKAANKDDPEALLEGVAMAGLVGVLRQLGDLAEFAVEIFHDLHEELMATSARGHGLMLRVQQLEAEVPSIERAFLSQTSHSLFLSNAGVDWHRNLRMDQNMITQGDLPRFVMDSYEECRGPPRLFLLDKFDVAGAGACLKRYSDPSFFKAEFTSSETMGADVRRERKDRKVKKKVSRWKNGENPEVFLTSHAKLHQLLSEERDSDIVHCLKLKRRQLNGFPLDSTTEKSYMEGFLDSHSAESKIFYENSLVIPHLNVESSNTSELGLEIREIGTASPPNKLLQGERGLKSSAERQERALEQSMYDLHDNTIKKGILEKFPEPICGVEVEKVPSTLHKLEDRKELMVDVERNKEAIVDAYQCDDITSEVDNYLDALATMESEMETDTEPNNDQGFFNTKSLGMDSDTNEEQWKHEAYFSESTSVVSSAESDDENNLLKRGRPNPSDMDTLRNLAVKGAKGSSGGDAVAKVATSAGTCPAEVVDVSSEKPSANGNTLISGSLEYVVPIASSNEVSVIPSYGSELVEASPNSCVTDSTSTVSHPSPAANLNEFQVWGLDFVGYPSTCMRSIPEAPFSNTEKETGNNSGDIPSTTNLSESSDALLHQSDISGLVIEGKYDGDTHEAHSVSLQQPFCLERQDLDVCSSIKRLECLPATTSPNDLDNLKSDMTSESDIGIQTTGESPEYLTSALDIQMTHVSAEQGLSEMTEEVPPLQSDVGVGSGNKPAGGVNEEPELDVVQLNYSSVGKAASIYSAPDSPQPASMTDCHPQIDNLAGTDHTEVDGMNYIKLEEGCLSSRDLGGFVSMVHSQLKGMAAGSIHAEANGEDSVVCQHLIGSPSRNHVKLEDECPSSNGNVDNLVSGSLNLIGSPSRTQINLQEECFGGAGSEQCKVETIQVFNPKRIIGEDAQKERNQLPASSGDLNVEVYNSESHGPSSSELPYNVYDALPVEHAQNHLQPRDVIGAATSSMKTDKKLQFAHRNQPSQGAEDPLFTSLSHQELSIPSEQGLNPFLPLPSTDTEDEKHEHYLLTEREEKAKTSLNSLAPPPVTKEAGPASDTLQGESSDLQNISVLKLNMKDGMLQPAIVTDEEPLNSFAPPTIKDEQPYNDFASSTIRDEEPLNSFAPPTVKDEQPPNDFASSTIKDEEPLNAFAPPTIKDEEPLPSSLTLEGETPSDESTLLPEAEVGETNGKPPRKPPRPRDPLIEAVASHDRSTMRKVTERVWPEMVQKMDERDSLLEQIRTKSFSLKPTAKPMITRSIIHGPRTNLKVAAILEKANAIRQATTGSDEEDDDDDSWSDS